jgi:hypothetical protein
VYHEQWLHRELHRNHPLFSQRIFTSGLITRWKPFVITGNGTDDNLGIMATGLPHHILLAERIRSVESEMELGLKRKLEAMEKLSDKLELLPAKVSSTLREEFNIEGAVAVSRHDLQEVIVTIRSEIQQMQQNLVPMLTASNSTPIETVHEQTEFDTFTWGERMHPIPQGFCFPVTLDVKTMWDLWWHGNASQRIRPYRWIKAFDFPKRSPHRVSLSKARGVMEHIEATGRILSPNSLRVSEMSKRERDAFFDLSFIHLINDIGRYEQVAVGELSYITIYGDIKKLGRT